ncbi:unnamed protein product [Notodromas monacha]|uniref:CSN8/PSMD8/EIF3K domain-containing protein n=1 Tax=Notodromas monacha TaxID=399045 RepID=A0A7R9GD81_9CRUS|nr:unnamed protein product [Notodromas monacha]CAG0918413.1 unnamed protein product [Notodromas monacha]
MTSSSESHARIQELESIELQDGLYDEQYLRLMALYLIENQLCDARMLWLRAPDEVKVAEGFFQKQFNVCQAIMARNYPEAYASIAGVNWPSEIALDMQAVSCEYGETMIVEFVKVNLKKRRLALIAKAYASIAISDMSISLGLSPESVREVCSNLKWTTGPGDLVYPKKIKEPPCAAIRGNTLVDHLSSVIQFLE